MSGLQDRKLGFKSAIVGLSGGLDSALVTYFAAKAIGPENVRVVLMPSQFSTDHSVSDAVHNDLMQNHQNPYNPYHLYHYRYNVVKDNLRHYVLIKYDYHELK